MCRDHTRQPRAQHRSRTRERQVSATGRIRGGSDAAPVPRVSSTTASAVEATDCSNCACAFTTPTLASYARVGVTPVPRSPERLFAPPHRGRRPPLSTRTPAQPPPHGTPANARQRALARTRQAGTLARRNLADTRSCGGESAPDEYRTVGALPRSPARPNKVYAARCELRPSDPPREHMRPMSLSCPLWPPALLATTANRGLPQARSCAARSRTVGSAEIRAFATVSSSPGHSIQAVRHVGRVRPHRAPAYADKLSRG